MNRYYKKNYYLIDKLFLFEFVFLLFNNKLKSQFYFVQPCAKHNRITFNKHVISNTFCHQTRSLHGGYILYNTCLGTYIVTFLLWLTYTHHYNVPTDIRYKLLITIKH